MCLYGKKFSYHNFQTLVFCILVGEGGFGKVYKAELKNSPDDSRLFASKKIKYRNSKELEKVKNEISILADLSESHIIQFFEAFYLEKSIVVVTEYLEGGELFEKVNIERFFFNHEILLVLMPRS